MSNKNIIVQNPSPRIAVIGSGYWGKNLVRNFAGLGALSVVCDSNTETLRALGKQYPSAERSRHMRRSCETMGFRQSRLPHRPKRTEPWCARL